MSGLPKITLGCDPELFVRLQGGGRFVTAYNLIPGDKKAPHKVNKGAIQVDGCAVEFNIDPVTTVSQWDNNIAMVQDQLKAALPPDHELVLQPTVTFDDAYWASVPDKAKEIGCEPDFSAYTGQHNPRPPGNGPMRSAAGHIHIGWRHGDDMRSVDDTDHMADCFEVVKQLDAYVGVPSLLWDKDPERRKLYGKAGACRIKPYGVEYRTPSNMWLADLASQHYVFNATLAALKDLFNGKVAREELGDNWAAHKINNPGLNFSSYSITKLSNMSDALNKAGLVEVQRHFKNKPKLDMDKFAGVLRPQNLADAARAFDNRFAEGNPFPPQPQNLEQAVHAWGVRRG